MSWDTFDVVLLRGFLPLILLGASVTRFCGFSFIYLFMLLLCPLVRYDIRQKRQMQYFLVLLIVLSSIFSLSIPAFHIPVILENEIYLSNCSNTVTRVLYQMGMTNLKEVTSSRIPRLVLPDYFVLVTAIIQLIYLIKRTYKPPELTSTIPISSDQAKSTAESPITNTTNVVLVDSVTGIMSSSPKGLYPHGDNINNNMNKTTVPLSPDLEETVIVDNNMRNKLLKKDISEEIVQPTTNHPLQQIHKVKTESMPNPQTYTLTPQPVTNTSIQQQQQQSNSRPRPTHEIHHNYLEETFGINRLQKKIWRAWAMQSLFVTVNVVITGLAGIISPSILNSVYLFSFLGVCTYWACGNKVITPNFAYMRIFLLMYSAVHVSLLYLCQIEFMQYYIPNAQLPSRLLGLYYLFDTSCAKKGEFIFQTQRWIDFFSPCVIVFVYYLYATETRRWFEKGTEGLPRVRSLKEDNPLKPSVSGDPELQHLIPDSIADRGDPTTSNILYPHPYYHHHHHHHHHHHYRQPHQRHQRHQSSTNNNYRTMKPSIPQSISTSLPMISFQASSSTVHIPDEDATITPGTAAAAQLLNRDVERGTVVGSSATNSSQQQTQLHPNSRGSVIKTAATSETLVAGSSGGGGAAAGGGTSRVSHKQQQPTTSADLAINNVNDDDDGSERFIDDDDDLDEGIGDDEVLCSDDNCNKYMRLSSYSNRHHRHRAILPPSHRERPLLLSLINTAIRNSYVFTFIAMMAWSVTYKSWMSFILLLLACLLWMMPDSRRACLYMSPIIVFYTTCLIIIQYIYGFNLSELPAEVTTASGNTIDLSEVGLQKSNTPITPLSVMIGFLVIFWLTLRLFMNERLFVKNGSRDKSELSIHELPIDQDSNADSEAYFGDVDNAIYLRTITFLNKICEKYWILVCCLAMLVVSIQSPNVFRIIYMIMLIYFQITFMISYSFWRKQMYVFWWVVIVYSVIILLGIYTFQFQQIPKLWENKTGFNNLLLQDIGLQQYKQATLFQSLLTPVVFLVVIIVQVRYFHEPFLKLSSMSRFQDGSTRDTGNNQTNLNASTASTSTSNASAFMEDVNEAFQAIVEKLKNFVESIYTTVWRFLEVHFTKTVAFLLMYACINEVSSSNIVLIFLMVICLPFPRLHRFFVTFSFLWCSIFVLLKMIYQLRTIAAFESNCSNSKSNETFDNAYYVGLKKVENFQYYVMLWTAILVSCSLWHAIRYHQRQYFNPSNMNKPPRGVIFEDVKANTLDDSLLTLLKFFFNYAFYKLGLELCFIMTVTVACLRVDVYSVVYLLMLLIFMCTPRKICAKLWPIYLLILGIIIPIQYAFCVGLPRGLCKNYLVINVNEKLQQWLFLPNTKEPPVAKKLIADFFQFLFVALQYQVFETEKSLNVNNFGGGKNRQILNNELPKTFDKDFVSTKDSYVDYLKHAVFYWSYWLSLAIVFMTGVVWITLFCLGYMILAFIYLWLGQNIMLRKRSNLIASWNVIIYYNYFVILSKCALQLMGCVYFDVMISAGLCWLIQLFGVQCINPMSWNINFPSKLNSLVANTITDSSTCAKVDTGLHWDVVCFFFIILQRKIFMTKNFCHVVLDLNVQNRFASRGAYLINRKMMATIRDQNDKEQRVLEKIQKKIEKIEMRQAQHGKPDLDEHYLVMRSGDYFLFEGDPEEDDEEVAHIGEDLLTKKALTYTEDVTIDESTNLQPSSGPFHTSKSISESTLTNNDIIGQIPTNAIGGQVQQANMNAEDQDLRYRGVILPKFSLNTIREHSVIGGDQKAKKSVDMSADLATTSCVSLPGQQMDNANQEMTGSVGNLPKMSTASYILGATKESSIASESHSSDEDDANPKQMVTPINPLQLINKAMEQGPRSAIREFKRTQSECRDPNISNTRRSSIHLGSRLESMEALKAQEKRRATIANSQLTKLKSEHDEMSSLPDTYTTPPPAHTSESNTDESYHSAAGPFQQQPQQAGTANNINVTQPTPSSSGRTSITTGPIHTTSTAIGTVSSIANNNQYEEQIQPSTSTQHHHHHHHNQQSNNFEDGREMFVESSSVLHKQTNDQINLDEEDRCSKHPESCWSKFKASMIIFYLFIQSTTDSLIILINGWTRESRRISRTLDNEKKLVKRRVISKINNEANTKIELESIVMEIVGDRNANVVTSKNHEEERKEQEFRRSRSRFFLLGIAVGNVAVVYSEFVCYFLLILNHMLSGNLMSLPYPLMVLLWAMLSVPRPSKNFWIALITYTEIVIVIKYIFQFKFIELENTQLTSDGFQSVLSVPAMIGIGKHENYAILDLIQLLFIFLHRGYLKNNGLWRDHTEFAQDLEKVDAEQCRDIPRTSFDEGIQPPSRKSCNPFYKIMRFYAKMTNPKFNKKVDVYMYMFLCEFISFLIIIFGYVSFGPGTDAADNAFDFIKTNKMPVPFVVMLIVQFIFFIIDRALFLRKLVMGKFIFQVFHVLLIHAWLFFALPFITNKLFNTHVAPQLLYFVKCIYFALSAYQMKSGYPLRILGNFLTKEFNYLNLFLFKGYMIVPFLYELRNVMDWMWTDTAVALYHWMEVEDVFCKIFVLKCWRRSELEYPTLRGHTRRLASKYSVGGLLLTFFFLCFWAPLTLSSFIGTTFVRNPPVQCLFTMSIEGYTPLYKFNARGNNIQEVNKDIFAQLKKCYQSNPPSNDYLQSFEADDGTLINMEGNSADAWYISPPSKEQLEKLLENVTQKASIESVLTCERKTLDAKSTEKIVTYTYIHELTKDEKRKILDGIKNNDDFTIPNVFPRFVTSYKRTLSSADQLLNAMNYTYLTVRYSKSYSNRSHTSWWTLKELRSEDLFCSKNSKNMKLYDELVLIMFNERVSDNIFGHLFSNYGILGMYAAYIFVAHRVLRAFYSDISYIIRCEELPHVDRILNLLNEIYLVRENKMFRLEEQLIAKLIFIYRSSETMIKWTRHKRSIIENHLEARQSSMSASVPPGLSNGSFVTTVPNDTNNHGIVLAAI